MNNKTTKKVIEKFIQLGRNIAAQRKKVKYSQNELAELLDISREHLAKIETAKRAVSLDLLILLNKHCLNTINHRLHLL